MTWFDDNTIPPYAAPCDECFNSYYHFAGCKHYDVRNLDEFLTYFDEKTDLDFFVEEADAETNDGERTLEANGERSQRNA